MIRLKSIRKTDALIECDIIPEDSKENGHLIVDASSGTIKDYSLPKVYEWCKNHVIHAKDMLLKLAKMSDIPQEKLVMWY